MTQATLEKLLGRELSQAEVDNLNLYMNIADERLMKLLCVRYDCEIGKRKFKTREHYRTLFTDIFNTVYGVTINGQPVTGWTEQQNNILNGKWYNSIVFNSPMSGATVEVDADWGFLVMPNDLNLLRARMFDLTFKEVGSEGIKSKSVEDFSITYNDSAMIDGFRDTNQLTIAKYSNCNQNLIANGELYNERFYCI
jgi:hypothetical protein